jgi:cell division septum initiation protein DivIVA
MNDDYEEILDDNYRLRKENDQLRADLRDARSALAANKAMFTDKLAQSRLSQRCDDCPKWKETDDE